MNPGGERTVQGRSIHSTGALLLWVLFEPVVHNLKSSYPCEDSTLLAMTTACTARREDFGSPYGALPGMVWYVQQRKRWSPYGALCATPSDLHNHIALDATRGALTHFRLARARCSGLYGPACTSLPVLPFQPTLVVIDHGTRRRSRVASLARSIRCGTRAQVSASRPTGTASVSMKGQTQTEKVQTSRMSSSLQG
jgi:hypothetical protein